MPGDLFSKWLKPSGGGQGGPAIFRERPGARQAGLTALRQILADHFVGAEAVLRAGGYKKAADLIANSLPSSKRTQSGDLAELLATEYIDSETTFTVPIRKLRWKSDRETPMHGNDVIAIDRGGARPRLLKCECKSRKVFSLSTCKEAAEILDKHHGRPNPSTLAFIAKRLFDEHRDKEAKGFQNVLQRAIRAQDVEHLIFALAGNDPTEPLASAPPPNHRAARAVPASL